MTAVIAAVLVGSTDYNISAESLSFRLVNNCGKSVIILEGLGWLRYCLGKIGNSGFST